MDSGYRLLAAKYVRRQVKQLASQLDGLRTAEDVEFIHRARVAMRRLRAGLRMFDGCFRRKQARRWRAAVRRMAANLGDARDRDVQIEFLCGILANLHVRDCLPGICRILVQLEHEREQLQRKVVRAVDRLEKEGVLDEMLRATKKPLRKAASWAKRLPSASAFLRTKQQVVRQRDELLSHQASLANPDDREGHHAMRIAAKRLRYTLEIAKSVHPKRLDEFLDAIKKLQSLLGDVHDCDVWVEHLNAFASRERRQITALFGHAVRFVRLLAGIDYLREDRQRHRSAVFGQLVEFWAELGRQEFWQRLADVVVTPAEAPAQPSTDGGVAPSDPASSTATEPPPDMSESRSHGDGANGDRAAPPKPLLTVGS